MYFGWLFFLIDNEKHNITNIDYRGGKEVTKSAVGDVEPFWQDYYRQGPAPAAAFVPQTRRSTLRVFTLGHSTEMEQHEACVGSDAYETGGFCC